MATIIYCQEGSKRYVRVISKNLTCAAGIVLHPLPSRFLLVLVSCSRNREFSINPLVKDQRTPAIVAGLKSARLHSYSSMHKENYFKKNNSELFRSHKQLSKTRKLNVARNRPS